MYCLKNFFIAISILLVLGCSQQKLTIFYDDNFEQTAKSIQQKVDQHQNDISVELKPIDFYHDFESIVLIHGANSQWQPVATIVDDVTGHYPAIFPAAISKHYYKTGQQGLYLVNKFQQEQFYSCLAGDAFFELDGQPGKSPLKATLFGDEEESDREYQLDNIQIGKGKITYSHPVVGTVELLPYQKDFRLYWQQSRCHFYLRGASTAEPASS